MDPHVIAIAAKVGNVIESLLAALRPGRDGPTAKVLRIIPHRSIGDPTRLTVRGRVVWQAPTNRRPLGPSGAITTPEHLAALYRAFDAVELPFAQVEARVDGVVARATCNAGGYFAIDLPAPQDAPWYAGRHRATVRLADMGPTARATMPHSNDTVTVEVFVPGAHATLAIVSDLDDTAMDTNTVHTFAAIRTVMFRSARRRTPVPGVADLYAALRDGPDGTALNPIYYISSGAWNLYDIVLDYLNTHALPDGAILLNDWGSRARAFHPVGHAHKGEHATALLSRMPQLPFLLIGDDVQEDPELYAEVAQRHPGRVPAIWIRAVRNDPARLQEIERLRPALARCGTGLLIAPDTAAFAADAARRGWLPHRLPPSAVQPVCSHR
jgi:phosphatidate phosphatase APP1